MRGFVARLTLSMLVVAGLAAASGAALTSCAMSPYSEERGVSNDGYIHVLGSPPEAQIYVDGQLKGYVGMERIRVSSGVHRVEVRCSGYVTLSRQVFVNQSTETIRADLTPLR